jgi:hypothetical protein
LDPDSIWTLGRVFVELRRMNTSRAANAMNSEQNRMSRTERICACAVRPWTNRRSLEVSSGRWLSFAALVLVVVGEGCVQPRYYYGRKRDSRLPKETALSPAVLVGEPEPQLDRVERVIHWPRDKWVEWRHRASSRVPVWLAKKGIATQEQTVLSAVRYLEDNDLHEVIVEARHHDPKEQWKRLQANPHIHPFWKYTDGASRVLVYTMLPPRVMRRDSYNPYTQTLSVNSSNPASAVVEAAQAKSHAGMKWPGVYAASRYLPLVPLGQQVVAANDALTYARTSEDLELEKAIYPMTYGRIAASALTAGITVVPEVGDSTVLAAPIARVAGQLTGTMAGEVMAGRLESDGEATERIQR